MKNIKVWFSGFVLVTIVWFSSIGCVSRGPFDTTKEVWDTSQNSINTSYQEKILSLYNNKNGNQIAFLGEKYHYIFTNNTQEFSELLKQREFLNLFKKNFDIRTALDSTDNRLITAHINLYIPNNNLNREQRRWLANHKFIPIDSIQSMNPYLDPYATPLPRNIKGVFYKKSFIIKGTRYLAKSEVNQRATKLKEPITLSIIGQQYKDKNRLYQIAVTPISLIGDVTSDILVIGANVLLSPLYLLILFAN
jgi:hypothetical protein